MGNIIGSFISGFAKVIGNLFGTPLDYLSGKSCSSICGSTWDFICYIENFCIANLLKILMVLVLSYIVLLFLYLLNKIGICGCVGRSVCKMVWSCFACCFSVWEYGCTFLWVKLRMLKRMNREHMRDIEQHSFRDYSVSNQSMSYHEPRFLGRRSRERRRVQLERSLRARSHRKIQVGISRGSVYRNNGNPIRHGKHVNTVHHHHNIKVTHMSKFVQKGNRYDRRISRKRRL